jgi:phosphohistidine phosphatase
MRRLMLLRHAKAERPQVGGADRDRVLAARGRADAPRIGAYMAHHDLVPDLVLVSPTARTRQTWDPVAEALPRRTTVKYEERLYDASVQSIMGLIREAGRGAHVLLVVGHNPSLHDLARLVIASGDVEARERLSEKLPTSGLAVIDFAFDEWPKLHPHSGRLDRFVTPRTLEEATD